MTEQQAIDFINAYEPVESPYNNISDEGHNARRCQALAMKEFGAGDYWAKNMRYLYIGYRSNYGETNPLERYGVKIGGQL